MKLAIIGLAIEALGAFLIYRATEIRTETTSTKYVTTGVCLLGIGITMILVGLFGTTH